jgi:hypothetical protein
MVKLITRIVLALVVAAGIGGGAAWYMTSGKVVEGATALIAAKSAETAADGSRYTITYESIARTGFPQVGVRLTNPELTITAPASATNPSPTTIRWKRIGTIDVITDYIAHEYRVISDGSGEFSVANADETVTAKSAPTVTRVAIKARDRDSFASWATLDLGDRAAVTAALKDLAGFELDMAPIAVTNSETGAPIYTQEAGTITFANRSTDGIIEFDADMQFKGSEVSAEYNAMIVDLLGDVNSPIPVNPEMMPFAASRAGKQDMHFVISAKVPKQDNMHQSNGHIDIPTMKVKNNFYEASMPLKIVLSEEDGLRKAEVKLDWTVDTTEAAAAEMHGMVDALLAIAMVASQQSKMAEADVQAIKGKVLEALPNVSALGPIALAVDLEASVPAPADPATAEETPMAPEKLNVRRFNFTHARWGLELAGEVSRERKVGMTVNATLNCAKCPQMTRDVHTATGQVQAVMNLLNPQNPRPLVAPETLTRLDAVLAELGKKDNASGDIVFTVTSPTPNDIRLADKPIGDAMTKLMVVFLPQIPAAGSTPPTMAPAAPAAPAAPVQR